MYACVFLSLFAPFLCAWCVLFLCLSLCCALSSDISIGGATGADAPGPRRRQEEKQKKNSCPELPQDPVNEIVGGQVGKVTLVSWYRRRK